MSFSEVVIEGTLKADGTLELDQKPNLPAGRVTVVLRKEGALPPPEGDWWQFMRHARKTLEEAGGHFMDEKEMQAHTDWLREGDHVDELLREGNAQREKREQP